MDHLLLLAAGLAQTAAEPVDVEPQGRSTTDVPAAAASQDPFAALGAISNERLRQLSGKGAIYGVDLSEVQQLQVGAFQGNESDMDGFVENTVVSDTVTGTADGNQITGNSGFTTVFINTGNNVVLQSNVQVNIYTPVAGQP